MTISGFACPSCSNYKLLLITAVLFRAFIQAVRSIKKFFNISCFIFYFIVALFNAPKKDVHAFGILGVVGPLDAVDSGWMVTDFAAWAFLISLMKGYLEDQSSWWPIRPIHNLFPEGFVTFGEPGCNRLQLPLPSLETECDPEASAALFVLQCFTALREVVQRVKPGEKLILLLIGHGESLATCPLMASFNFSYLQSPTG
jgi:hypothetical protein